MTNKKHKVVFNLTIDDLKELGIIKKRKSRTNKHKYIKYYITNTNKMLTLNFKYRAVNSPE